MPGKSANNSRIRSEMKLERFLKSLTLQMIPYSMHKKWRKYFLKSIKKIKVQAVLKIQREKHEIHAVYGQTLPIFR